MNQSFNSICGLLPDMAEFVVGLRGGIGTGKSTVSDLFADRGIAIADADVSARTVVEPGQPAFDAIVARFGSDILMDDQSINRPKLREIVFANVEDRKFLEQQTHRPIIEDLISILQHADSDYAVLVLSTGTGKSPMMHRLLVVDAPPEVQVQRVMARDQNSRSQVEAIIEAQAPRNERLRDSDDVIVNEGDISQLEVEVEKLHHLYLQIAESRKVH